MAEIAHDSNRVFFTFHAEERMAARGLTRIQVLRCLKHGHLDEHPVRDLHGGIKMTLESISAGQPMKVVAALSENVAGEVVVVVTAWRL